MKILLFLWAFLNVFYNFSSAVALAAPDRFWNKITAEFTYWCLSRASFELPHSARLKASSVLAPGCRDLVHLPKVNLSHWERLTQSSCEFEEVASFCESLSLGNNWLITVNNDYNRLCVFSWNYFWQDLTCRNHVLLQLCGINFRKEIKSVPVLLSFQKFFSLSKIEEKLEKNIVGTLNYFIFKNVFIYMPNLYNMQLKIIYGLKKPNSYTIWLSSPQAGSQSSLAGIAGYNNAFTDQYIRLLVQDIKEKRNTAVPCLGRPEGVRLKAWEWFSGAQHTPQLLRFGFLNLF